jgi:hypothetical protein
MSGRFLIKPPWIGMAKAHTLLVKLLSKYKSITTKTAPFSSVDAHNPATTRSLVIYQLDKNVHFINSVLSVSYKKHEICKHFQ